MLRETAGRLLKRQTDKPSEQDWEEGAAICRVNGPPLDVFLQLNLTSEDPTLRNSLVDQCLGSWAFTIRAQVQPLVSKLTSPQVAWPKNKNKQKTE